MLRDRCDMLDHCQPCSRHNHGEHCRFRKARIVARIPTGEARSLETFVSGSGSRCATPDGRRPSPAEKKDVNFILKHTCGPLVELLDAELALLPRDAKLTVATARSRRPPSTRQPTKSVVDRSGLEGERQLCDGCGTTILCLYRVCAHCGCEACLKCTSAWQAAGAKPPHVEKMCQHDLNSWTHFSRLAPHTITGLRASASEGWTAYRSSRAGTGNAGSSSSNNVGSGPPSSSRAAAKAAAPPPMLEPPKKRAAPPPPPKPEPEDLWSMKKDDLKEKCRQMGLAVGGNNEALIARIREATGADLYELKKEDLKERCRKKGLPVGGNNEALIERLKEAMGGGGEAKKEEEEEGGGWEEEAAEEEEEVKEEASSSNGGWLAEGEQRLRSLHAKLLSHAARINPWSKAKQEEEAYPICASRTRSAASSSSASAPPRRRPPRQTRRPPLQSSRRVVARRAKT